MSLISLISLQESGKYIIKQNDPNSEKKDKNNISLLMWKL